LIETGLLVLKKKFFFNINICKYGFPYCEKTLFPTPGDHDVNNSDDYIISENFYDLFWLSGSGEEDF
jgi:hypothetical protein